MPRGDGTGPEGKGPKTGRGLGPCEGTPQRGQGLGLGRGRGRGRGQGLGLGRGRGTGGRGRNFANKPLDNKKDNEE